MVHASCGHAYGLVNTRAQLLPNPQEDAVCCVFWCLQTPQYATPTGGKSDRYSVEEVHLAYIRGFKVD